MPSQEYLAEFVILIVLYFKYFFNVVFICYKLDSTKKWEYQNLAAELQRLLPDYTVQWGYIQPPNIILLIGILALQFWFKGLYNLISKIFQMTVKKALLTISLTFLFVILPFLMETKNDFGIHYESHNIYSKNISDLEFVDVDQMVEIIKENATGFTLPRGLAVAGILFIPRIIKSIKRRR
ncbi:uncharacterized protein [Drosophila kikkawai]|uniref:Uncharacterized protein n=1 Tax=Drosophila kikkawai TaxID=30033 RepID=A0A6P4HXQ3_DROKI|nr:uncharacterized protein LOC108073868 [Drosophila kikkawai]